MVSNHYWDGKKYPADIRFHPRIKVGINVRIASPHKSNCDYCQRYLTEHAITA